MGRPSLYLLLAASLLFTVGGVVMIAVGRDGGIPVTLFSGLCAAVGVWKLWPELLDREQRSLEELLASYPQPVELHTSPVKLVFLALLSLIFGAVALWMLVSVPMDRLKQILVWPGAIMFLAGSPVLLYLAMTRASLRLTTDGFEIAHGVRRHFSSWRNVSEFEASIISGTALVCYDDAGAGASRIVAMNRKLSGRSSALADTYGLNPEDLTTLLNAWRERSLAQAAVP